MDPKTEVYNDLSPYFQYSSPSNNYIVNSVAKNRDGYVRAQRIFQNCVACNAQRFSTDELTLKLKDVNTIHCGKCVSTFLKIQQEKYFPRTFKSKEHEQAFDELFDNFVGWTHEENCQDPRVLARYKEQSLENLNNSLIRCTRPEEYARRVQLVKNWDHIPGTQKL